MSGSVSVSMTEPNFYPLCHHLGELCRKKGIRIATAESCTGGSVSTYLTSISGSSEWFNGAIVAYSNSAKTHLLQVASDLLEKNGAVSEPVAKAMAQGALHVLQSDVAISITGVAGPLGGTAEKPVGMVCFALANHHEQTCIAKTMHFGSGRDFIRKSAALFALEWLNMHITTL
ncbi:MAG: hypothetical protein ACD_42C00118G0002 [uncultured bacterium]|nr:MAG: hypothetical protein ACD_42C00118G0002 [uncultured bacterium]